MKIDARGIRVQDDFTIKYDDGFEATIEARDFRAAVTKLHVQYSRRSHLSMDDIAFVEEYPHSRTIYRVLPGGSTLKLGSIRRSLK